MTDKALFALIAAVVLVIAGGLIYRNYFNKEMQPAPAGTSIAVPDATGTRHQTETRVRIRVTQCVRDFGRTRMLGVVRNTGNVDLHFVTLRTIWKNDAGTVIGSDLLYALNGGLLAAGDELEFSDVSELTTATRCNAEAVDWW